MMNSIQKITAVVVASAGCFVINPFKTNALTPNLFPSELGISVLAQSPDQSTPVQTPEQDNQEDTLKPVEHFNGKAPVRLKLINQTKRSLEAGLSTGETKHIPQGGDITLGPLPLPINCFVYPTKTSRNPSNKIVLKYNVSVDNSSNVVNVTILQYDRKSNNNLEGDSAISLRRFGSVFVY
jgi:hypothetical protein